MHNIQINFGKFYQMCKQFFEGEADRHCNLESIQEARVWQI
jgi:hypothetical protein